MSFSRRGNWVEEAALYKIAGHTRYEPGNEGARKTGLRVIHHDEHTPSSDWGASGSVWGSFDKSSVTHAPAPRSTRRMERLRAAVEAEMVEEESTVESKLGGSDDAWRTSSSDFAHPGSSPGPRGRRVMRTQDGSEAWMRSDNVCAEFGVHSAQPTMTRRELETLVSSGAIGDEAVR